MTRSNRLARSCLGVARLLCIASLAILLASIPLSGRQIDRKTVEDAQRKGHRPTRDPGAMEVRFNDNSSLKLSLREEKIELYTPYGKLAVPISDIQRIDVGLRISEEVAQRIQKAVADLGSPNFRAREAAEEELLSLREKAYPSLLHASQQSDPEVARRAEKVLTQLRDAYSPELLEVPSQDIIHTLDSKIAGRIPAASLKVHTYQFGDLQVKLADARTFRSLWSGSVDSQTALPDPGTLVGFAQQIGKSFIFRVTGTSEGNLWGTGLHTLDSNLAKAAVHAGIVKVGQTGTVKVTICPPQTSFQGSTQHGITSSSYGPYQGSYRIERGG